MKKKILITILTAALSAAALAGCGNSAQNTASNATNGNIQKVKVAFTTTAYPMGYLDENGNPTGYEVEAIKAVDALLEDYEFEFEGVGDYSLLYSGLATGTYDVVLSNAFWTQERADNYNIPQTPMGNSTIGMLVPNEDADRIKTLADVYDLRYKLQPLPAGNGKAYVIDQYNEENPDKKLTYEAIDTMPALSTVLQYIEEGRYNVGIEVYFQYLNNVVVDDASLHAYNDKITFIPIKNVGTYPIIAKNETELSDAINGALETLTQNGTLVELSEKFYGYNQFEIQK